MLPMRRTYLAVLLLSPMLAAQVVSPPFFAVTEAPSNNTFPFGGSTATSTPFRYLQVHDDVPAMVIQGMSFRHDNVFTGSAKPAYTLTLDAWMSTAAAGVTAQTAVATFDSNHDAATKIQVVTNRTISIAANDPTQVPSPFVLDLAFDTGVVFPYPAGGVSLVWEVHVTARTNTSTIAYDAVSALGTTWQNPPLAASRGGVGCIATGETSPMTLAPTATAMDWPNNTGNLLINASNLENNGLIVWINGLDRTQWAGVPLPFVVPLSPGAPSGTCTLYTDLVVTTATFASATGTAQLALTFPVTPALHGATIYTQVLGIDAPANPLGFTLSNLAVQQLCAPYPIPLAGSRVYLAGSLGAAGTVGLTTHLITQFY
jgi:hypothetical protein